MKYFRIKESIDIKEIGNTYPQIQDAEYTCNTFEDENFIENIGYKKIDFIPKLPIGKLHKKAKLTDFLSAAPDGYTRRLVISNKLKNRLPDTGNYQLFSTKIKLNKNNRIDYWLLNPINFYHENIDYNHTEFYLVESSFSKGEKLGHPYQLRMRKLKLNKNNGLDFIIINKILGGVTYFVSDNLKKKIEKEGITGLVFEEI